MPDIYEKSKPRLTCDVAQPPPGPTVTFRLRRNGNLMGNPIEVPADSATVEARAPALPEVGPNEPNYTLTYECEVNNVTRAGAETFTVWPQKLLLRLYHGRPGSGAEDRYHGIKFTFEQNNVTKDAPAAEDGLATIKLATAAFTVAPPATHRIARRQDVSLRELKLWVDARVKAKFLAPAQPADSKQYVNLPTADPNANPGHDAKGNVVRFEVGAFSQSDVRGGVTGNSVFVSVVFSRASARTTPEPRLIAVQGSQLLDLVVSGDKKTHTARIQLPSDRASVKFDVDLGLAGGDTCTVKVGGTEACGDETRTFTNWRKLAYELVLPKASGNDKLTDITTRLPAAAESYINDALAGQSGVFIELVRTAQHAFTAADLPDNGAHHRLDAGFFIANKAGGTACIVTRDQAAALLQQYIPNPDKRTLAVLLVDVLVKPLAWSETFPDISTPGVIKRKAGAKTMLPKTISTDENLAVGVLPIAKLAWKVTHYESAPNTWTSVTQPNQPGGAFTNNTELTDPQAIAAHVTIQRNSDIEFKFPTAGPGQADYPANRLQIANGKLVDRATQTAVRVALAVQGVDYQYESNGVALQGNTKLQTQVGAFHDLAIGRVFVHELGHCAGMAYGTHAEPGVPVPAKLDAQNLNANLYDAHGHQGNHCAAGQAPNDRQLANFSPDGATHRRLAAAAACVMWGGGDPTAGDQKLFCATCQGHLKARDLSDVRRSWK